jgi:hypothetical protein
VTNNYLDLAPVVGRLAEHSGLHHAEVFLRAIEHTSHWVLLTRDAGLLGHPAIAGGITPGRSERRARLWTDERTNLLEVLDF